MLSLGLFSAQYNLMIICELYFPLSILALCVPHTFSEDGLTPCSHCPLNYYQLDYGSTDCIPCDDKDDDDDTVLINQCITSG